MISLALVSLFVAVNQAIPLTLTTSNGQPVNASDVFGDGASENPQTNLTAWPEKTPFEIYFLENDYLFLKFYKKYNSHPDLTNAAVHMFDNPIRNLQTMEPNLPGPSDFDVSGKPSDHPWCICRSLRGEYIPWTVGNAILFMRTLQHYYGQNQFVEYKFDMYDRKKSGGGRIAHCKFKKDKPTVRGTEDPDDENDPEDSLLGVYNATSVPLVPSTASPIETYK